MNWQSLGMVSGAALLGASALQALAAAYLGQVRTRVARARYSRQRTAFDQKLQSVLKWARAAKPIFKDWSGTRPFRVAAVVDEATDCKSFYLVPVDGRPLSRFEPGQFLTFRLPVDPKQRPLVRCYSLSNRPREDYFRVTVKQVGPPVGNGGLPAGRGSTFFSHRVRVGSILEVQSPQGAFFLDPRDQLPVVLVGGGIGISPIMSMASAIAHDRSGRKTFVFAGFRNSREHPFCEALRELHTQHDNLHIDVSYSRPMPGDRLGRDYSHRGRIDVARLREVLPSNNFHYYVCGPASMMESLVPALLKWGVPEAHVHFEAFGPASVKGLRSKAATAPCKVAFALAEKILHWSGEHSSLLDLSEANDLVLDFGCRAGNCGQCLISVREGKVSHIKEPGLPLCDSDCLTCIAVPQGDLVLEA